MSATATASETSAPAAAEPTKSAPAASAPPAAPVAADPKQATPAEAKTAPTTPAAGTTPDAKPAATVLTAPPDKYEFKAAEGAKVDEALAAEVGALAKDLGLSQDAAQKLYDRDAGRSAAMEAAARERLLEASRTTWVESLKADKEIGGEKFAENAEIAKRAVERFGTPALKQILNDTGLGNHPELVRTFVKVGRLIAPDTIHPTGQPAGNKPSVAQRLYGSTAPKSQE